ncbi:peptidase M36 [Dimargaris cristalligena]|uniref:Extracellular metalloproteinase n=1 Tax=Dimargaris cristalligena TaxID=215637 RepID=A0A4P9ZU44_9FUNG|nr:peptidase M36 [Dimargaris cristalligena]|eukprot:RKP37116.1 peptidase M36 [Dimargaris cristalligena]
MGDQRFSDTQGNYVVVQSHRDVSIDWKQAQRPQGDDQGQFDFPLDLSSDPSSYSDASATQAFYLGNLFSGFAKAYGFDAASGNFQGTHTAEDNAGNGVAGDRVIIYVQDGKGFNNANFATPADGQSPVMKMYIWNKTKPSRDGAFETPIFVHEFTHGVTSRLTGGRAASNCLTQGVAAGMGEGWSDIIALNWRLRAGDENGRNAHGQPDRPLGIGTYGNGGNTVRPYIYTTNVDQNPLQFGHLSDARFKTVHNIGTIWTTMLYEILWNYIAQHGLEPDFIRNPTSTKGNTMFMRMLFASWKLQPCSPDFLQARSAMLQADKRLHQEQNKCLIWRGFAKRGMGEDATYSSSGVVESDKVPSDCE